MPAASRLLRLLPKPARNKLLDVAEGIFARQGFQHMEDGLFTVHDQSFRQDPSFREAYARGVQASNGVDQRIPWRLSVALWAARTALRTPGDFVECGVNAGFMSSAIMRRLNWAEVPRSYYLVDTFSGPPLAQYSEAEIATGRVDVARKAIDDGAYVTDVDRVRANFAEWPNAVVVQGAVPEILDRVAAAEVAFLHLDMNCAAPETAAMRHFWPKMSRGGIVLLDDYAYVDYGEQKRALDEVARSLGFDILAMPTGQGLIVA